MRQDTVAAAVAAKYGVSKADLLESGENDVAVRMALGEAQVIADTKDQLSAAGVDPGALEAAAASSGANANKTGVPGVKRSNVAILLKNLPFESEVNELRGLCERFGGVARMVLPDTKTIAVVEWLEPGDARKAFKGLAYKRYRHVPIYVEWAPEGIFTGDQPVGTVNGAPARTPKIDGGGLGLQKMRERDAIVNAKAKNSDDDDDGDDAGDAEATRLFVKGLSFNTTDASLRAHFLRAAAAASGRVLAATVATQKGPGGANLSRGFGFVEFDSPGAARSAKRAMQGKELDGRALRLEISSAAAAAAATTIRIRIRFPRARARRRSSFATWRSRPRNATFRSSSTPSARSNRAACRRSLTARTGGSRLSSCPPSARRRRRSRRSRGRTCTGAGSRSSAPRRVMTWRPFGRRRRRGSKPANRVTPPRRGSSCQSRKDARIGENRRSNLTLASEGKNR